MILVEHPAVVACDLREAVALGQDRHVALTYLPLFGEFGDDRLRFVIIGELLLRHELFPDFIVEFIV